jgi:hypothetical protein
MNSVFDRARTPAAGRVHALRSDGEPCASGGTLEFVEVWVVML